MKDSDRSHIHLTVPRSAIFFEEWMRSKLEFDDILVLPEHEPVNPDDSDNAVADQQAAFGISKVQQKDKPPAWRDLGLEELLNRGPEEEDLNAIIREKVLL